MKIGDNIVCICKGGNEFLTLGKTYEVVNVDWVYEKIQIVDDSGSIQTYFSRRFEKNKEVKVYGIVFFCASLNKEKK